MLRKAHFAGFAVLIALIAVPSCGAASASVSGVVRNSAGIPQIGAQVQLLRPDLTVVASVFTNSKGRFSIASVMPGRYAVKAMGMTYLPSLRENVRVRTGTIVNLTLNTLYEVMQWLPSQPGNGKSQTDDWMWTLRSAENRPLLRWLEDGPLVVVSDGPGTTPKLKARLMATGQEGTFGESGERISTSLEDTPTNSRELLARVDFSPNTDAGMESMLGFSQDLGFAGSVQSVAAVAIQPEVNGPDSDGGLDEAAIRAWETLHLGDEFEVEAGSTEVIGRLNGEAPETVMAALPNISVNWNGGNSTVGYRLATAVPGPNGADETQAGTWLPAFAVRNGTLVMERGVHQELGWRRTTDISRMAVVVYHDNLQNPVMEAQGTFTGAQGPQALFDRGSKLMRTAGPNLSTQGVTASVQRKLPCGNDVRLSYANGTALVMPAMPRPAAAAEVLGVAHPRRAQTYSIALSGTLEGTGTHWRASYRWQPDDTVTEIAPYAIKADEPYLNVKVRQVIHSSRDGVGGIEALLDVQNLLAQGYRPYLLNDGSVLIFAQQQRGIRGGLAFTF